MDGGRQLTIFITSIQVVGSNIYSIDACVCLNISFTSTQIITVHIYCAAIPAPPTRYFVSVRSQQGRHDMLTQVMEESLTNKLRGRCGQGTIPRGQQQWLVSQSVFTQASGITQTFVTVSVCLLMCVFVCI